MYRALALLLSPLITVGLVYAFGIGAVIVCFALVLLTLKLSTGESLDGTPGKNSSGFSFLTVSGDL